MTNPSRVVTESFRLSKLYFTLVLHHKLPKSNRFKSHITTYTFKYLRLIHPELEDRGSVYGRGYIIIFASKSRKTLVSLPKFLFPIDTGRYLRGDKTAGARK